MVIFNSKKLVLKKKTITKESSLLTAVRVGKTQSNISMPSATQTTKSAAKPTPIKYRGLSSGSRSVHLFTIRQKSSLHSPPLNEKTNDIF